MEAGEPNSSGRAVSTLRLKELRGQVDDSNAPEQHKAGGPTTEQQDRDRVPADHQRRDARGQRLQRCPESVRGQCPEPVRGQCPETVRHLLGAPLLGVRRVCVF